jgi:ABC-type tungstate transport system substrate-binding protein
VNTLLAVPTVFIGLMVYALLTRQSVFGEYGLSIAWGVILMAIALTINLLTQWIKSKMS